MDSANTRKPSLLRQLATNTLLLSLGSVFARGMVLLGVMMVARILDRGDFGHFAIIQSSIVTAAIFAGMGLGSTATRHIAQMKETNLAGLNLLLTLTSRLALGSAVLLTLLMVLGADTISAVILNAPDLGTLLAVGAVSMFFNILHGYFNASLVGFEAIRKSALAQASASAISVPVLIGLTWGYGLPGAVAGLIAQAVLLCGFSYTFYRQECRRWNIQRDKNFGSREYSVLWHYSLPAFIFNLMIMPAHWVCNAMILRSEDGNIEMAAVGVVMQWYFAIMFLPSIAAHVFFPVMSKLANSGDSKDTKDLLVVSFLGNAAASIPLAIGLAFFSSQIMGMYGASYQDDWSVLVMAVFAAAIATLVVPFNLYIVANGKVWTAAGVNLVWALCYIVLCSAWIDQGALALTRAIFCAHILQLLLMAGLTFWLRRQPQ